MKNITIFDDYFSFKNENKNLINYLVKDNGIILNIMRPALIVVDYLYEYRLKNKLSNDEEYIFSVGYDYLYDQFFLIKSILNKYLNNDYKELKKYEKAISLLLYIHDYKEEISIKFSLSKYMKSFSDLEEKVYDLIKNHEDIDDNYFILLNDLVYKTFDANGVELKTVNEIFYNIALEYNIIKEDENIDIFKKY